MTKPSLVTSNLTFLGSVVGAAARLTGVMPTIGIEELAAAMVQQIRDGFEKEPLMNDNLKRIGRKALEDAKREEAKE